MSRSGYPTFMFLEFELGNGSLAAIGSDCMFHLDGRLNQFNAEMEIADKARQIIKSKTGLKLVGYTRRGNHKLVKFHKGFVDYVNKTGV